MRANRVGHSDYRGLEYRRVIVDRFLNLLRRYIETVANNDFFLAPFEPEVSITIAPGQITRNCL